MFNLHRVVERHSLGLVIVAVPEETVPIRRDCAISGLKWLILLAAYIALGMGVELKQYLCCKSWRILSAKCLPS